MFADVDVEVQLAINTAQLGRTFQDRTHVFAIRPKPEGVVEGQSIFNMNVSYGYLHVSVSGVNSSTLHIMTKSC